MSAETTARQARVERKTKETEISLQLNLDGTGASKVHTPIPFFSHMLEAWAKHGLMDLTVEAQGDVEVDQHHTVERSEEHTSELQSLAYLVCRLLLEKKKTQNA